MKYQFVGEQSKDFDVSEICEALEVHRSSYYGWRNRGLSASKKFELELKAEIAEIEKSAKGRYGHRPVYDHLVKAGISCGRDRTLRLMKELGITRSKKKGYKPIGTQSNHGLGYSPNLLRQLGKPSHCNQVWVADTTYLSTEQGWMYLGTVMDLFSRKILGWSVSSSNDSALVCQALKSALGGRGKIPPGIIHHSDRGSTYASFDYQNLVTSHGMKSSMSAKGNCYDNAAMESFYGRYKSSSIRGHVFSSEAELRANVFDYIEVFYNRYRKHSSLGYSSPIEFEQKLSPRS
jgi:putative transposase